jgi:O-antigen/teichoic acid export membrane protein
VRAVALVTLPLTSAVTAVVTYWILDEADTATRWAVAVGMGLLVWLSGQQKLWANYLRGFGEVRFASLLEGRSGGVLVSAGQGLLVGAVLLFFAGLGLAGALGALAVGYAVPVAVAWRRVARHWRHVRAGGRTFRDVGVVARQHWRFTSTLLGGYLNSTVEIWIAGLVLTAVESSLFSAAQRLSILLSIPLVSLGVVYSPVVARLAGKDDARLEKLLRTGASVAGLVTAVAWIPMLLVPGPLLGLVFGSAFAAAAPALMFLTVGNVVNVATGMCGTALSMSRYEGVTAMVQWLALTARVPAGVLAALFLGAAGLGASAAVVTASMYVALWLLARRRTGLRTHLTFRPSLRLMRETAG